MTFKAVPAHAVINAQPVSVKVIMAFCQLAFCHCDGFHMLLESRLLARANP